MKKTNYRWKSCFAEPRRGLAFFDGITIETDSFLDPRYDRVIPVMEEEQIFMCRQMAQKLRSLGQNSNKPLLALDMGTGSGVFAIYAVKHCKCKVLALDINPRALNFARCNAIKNKIFIYETRKKFLDGKKPGICFEQGDFLGKDESLKWIWPQDGKYTKPLSEFLFDAIFLNPPYNPTPEGISPALHAEAGIDGQKAFKEQMKNIPGLLKKGGVCFGIQMTIVCKHRCDKEDHYLFEKYFDPGDSILSIIDGDIPIPEFLRRQYRGVIGNDKLNQYIQKVVQEVKCNDGEPFFRLVYYELTQTKQASHKKLRSIKEFDPEKWEDRIKWHREIVKHTSNPIIKPFFTIFLQDLYPASHTASSFDNKTSIFLEPNIVLKFVFKILESFDIIGVDEDKFNMIFISSAPYYSDAKKIGRLTDECQVKFANNDFSYDKKKEIIRSWQHNIKVLQTKKTGLYLHPHFVGITPSSFGGNFGFSAVKEDIVETAILGDKKLFKIVDRINSEGDDEIPYEDFKIGDVGPDLYYKTQLSSYSVAENYIDVIKAVNERINSTFSKESDFNACHYSAHKRIIERFRKILGKDLEWSWSFFICVPLSLKIEEHIENSSIELPASFRGGFWIFATTPHEWSHNYEKRLLELARLIWLLYSGQYNLEAAKEARKFGKRLGKLGVLHQIPKDMAAHYDSFKTFSKRIDELREKNPGIGIPRCPRFDALSVSMMFLKAANEGLLFEMPEECAKILHKTWDNTTIEEFVKWVVWPQARQKVFAIPGVYDKLNQPQYQYLTEVDIEKEFKVPILSIPVSFELTTKKKGLYPLVLIALTNAYEHAYKHTILDTGKPGQITITYYNTDEVEIITISNSGRRPGNEKFLPQDGFIKDIETFEGLTGGWIIDHKDKDGTDYCRYDEDDGLWKCVIKYDKKEK